MSFVSTFLGNLGLGPATLPRAAAAPPSAQPFGRASQVDDSRKLIGVLGLVGPALVTTQGTFLRMLEVAPVDLESGDRRIKESHWLSFSQALRRLRAPAAWQILITSRLQDTTDLQQHWYELELEWDTLAQRAEAPRVAARRARLAELAREKREFIEAIGEKLSPMQQRYLLILPMNPFGLSGPRGTIQGLSDKLVKDTLEALEEQVKLARSMLAEMNLSASELDGPEMCQALWEHYHHPPTWLGSGLSTGQVVEGQMVMRKLLTDPPARAAFIQAGADGAALADLIAPELIEELPDHVRVGEVLARGYEILDFDPEQPVDLTAILSLPLDATHSLFLTAMDPALVRQRFRRKEVELRAIELGRAKLGVINDYANGAAIDSITEVRRQLEVTAQAPIDLRWLTLIWANTPENLERACRAFESTLKLRGIRFNRGTRRHQAIFQSIRPCGDVKYRLQARMMSADSLGGFFPFVRRPYVEPGGLDYGVHRGNGLLVCLEPFQRGNANASQLIIASPRSGKSTFAKRWIDEVAAQGHRVFVIDPEREYLRQAVDLHAPYIELGAAHRELRVRLEPDAPEGVLAGLSDLQERYTALCGRDLNPRQNDALHQAYADALADAGIQVADPATWRREPPRLRAVLDALQAQANPEARETARVLAYLEALAGGGTINVMELRSRAEDPWRSACEGLAGFVQAPLGRSLDAAHFNVLVKAYQATIERFGDATPLLADLADTLARQREPEAAALASAIEQYARGLYAPLFNQPTTVDVSQEPVVVFGLRALRENIDGKLAAAVIWLILRLVWNEIVANAGSGQPTHLVIDESHLIWGGPGAAERLQQFARSFPKYQAALHLITQHADAMLADPRTAVIKDITAVKILLRHENADIVRRLGEAFNLTPAEQHDLQRVAKGEGLLLYGDQVRIPIYVPVDPRRLDLLSSGADQQAAVSRASGLATQAVR